MEKVTLAKRQKHHSHIILLLLLSSLLMRENNIINTNGIFMILGFLFHSVGSRLYREQNATVMMRGSLNVTWPGLSFEGQLCYMARVEL